MSAKLKEPKPKNFDAGTFAWHVSIPAVYTAIDKMQHKIYQPRYGYVSSTYARQLADWLRDAADYLDAANEELK